MAALEELIRMASDHRRNGDLVEAERLLKRCYDSAPDDPQLRKDLFGVYQQNLDVLKLSPYMDYPLFVSVETLALCNAKCGFCPYPKMERQGTQMPDRLVDKIISDLKDIPRAISFRLSPFKVSDPFVEPRLFAIIGKINAELPNASIDLYSNGAALTPKKLDALSSVKNFQYLNI